MTIYKYVCTACMDVICHRKSVLIKTYYVHVCFVPYRDVLHTIVKNVPTKVYN